MSEIPGTEEIRTLPQTENTLPSEESKKVTWFGSYQATNVIILIFIIIAAAGIITGSISLSEKTEQKTIRNVSSADFVTEVQPTGPKVTQQSDGKYVVSLDYTRPVSGGGYINYLDSATLAGSAEASRALVLDSGKEISGITSLTSTNIFGQIGSDTSQSDGYFSDVYINGTLISGDTSSNTLDGFRTAIIGGENNIINADEPDNCGIFAGNNNGISGLIQGRSVVLGGQINNITGDASYHSVIAGGQGSSIAGTESRNSGIIGGFQNKIEGTRSYQSFIAGGNENIISGTSANNSGIIGGNINKINSQFTFIGGGEGLSTQGGSSWDSTALVGRYNNYTTYPWDGTTDSSGTCYRFIVGSGDSTTGNNAFVVDDKGNLYFGTDTGASIYQRTGSDQYTVKAFTIQHPTIANRWLRHGCLEGPEGGVYYRGKGEAPATIRLPDYATHIASDFTVQVTPIGSPRLMSASEVSPEGTFRVYGEGRFHWTAIGERVSLDPEPLKTDVTIHSMGPYSWSV